MEDGRRHLPRARDLARAKCGPARSPYLVDGAAGFLVGKRDDDTLDLPPMAKADHITLVAAVFGTRSCFEPGIIAVGLEQQSGVGQGGAAIDEGRVHDLPITPCLLADRRTDKVNETSTMFATHHAWDKRPTRASSMLAACIGDGHGNPMKHRSTAAGGIFLFLGLLLGAIYGISVGQPMLWLLRGFGVGIVLAVLVWLLNRRTT